MPNVVFDLSDTSEDLSDMYDVLSDLSDCCGTAPRKPKRYIRTSSLEFAIDECFDERMGFRIYVIYMYR